VRARAGVGTVSKLLRTGLPVRIRPELLSSARSWDARTEPPENVTEDSMSRDDAEQLSRLSAKISEIEGSPYAERLRRSALLKALYAETAEIRRWAR
jgi:hypothetical protein